MLTKFEIKGEFMHAFKAINLFFLGALIGVELFLGIFGAKIIFYAPVSLADGGVVDMFARGMLMSAIFQALGYVMVAICALNLLYELVALRDNANFKQKISKIFLALINLALSLLFLLYYTSEILQVQNEIVQGAKSIEALASEEFRAFHAQSERLVKVLVIAQMLLFFLNFVSKKCVTQNKE